MRREDEQKHLRAENSIALEYFATSLFGDTYWHSADYTEISFWRKMYLRTLKVLEHSIPRCIGSVDRTHRDDILFEVSSMRQKLEVARRKDDIHCALIAGLFRLTFLLLGRRPYKARGNFRQLNTFRTISYCQTIDQFGLLLRGYVEGQAKTIGYEDSFDLRMRFLHWRKERKLHENDGHFVQWVEEVHPNLLNKFR